MRIAFDIDDVLKSREKFMLGAENNDKTLLGYKVVNPEGYDIEEIYECDKKMEVRFWTKNAMKYAKVPLFDDVLETIKKLKEDGHQICILTSRAKACEKSIKGFIMRKLISKELKTIKKYVDNYYYVPLEKGEEAKEKGLVCNMHGIDIMVEDDIRNIRGILKNSPTTKVICMNTKNNAKYRELSICKVSTINEAYEAICAHVEHRDRFCLLSQKQRESLSVQTLKEYNEKLKSYYLSLPYDSDISIKEEKQCIKFFKRTQAVFRFLYNPKVINKDHDIKCNVGDIFVSNHLHSFDPYLTSLALDQKSGFVLFAKEKIRTHPLGWIFRYIGATFCDENDERSKNIATTKIIKHLLHGRDVIWYPEGSRNRQEEYSNGDKPLQQFNYGIYRIAQITGSKIYHFALTDDYKLFKKNNLKVICGGRVVVNERDSLEDCVKRSRTIVEKLKCELYS